MAAAARQDRDLRIARNLPVCALASQLHARFVQKAPSVQPPGRELSAVRVQRQRAVERDARSTLDEWAALTDRAEAEQFEPRQAVEREAVVDLGHVDVARPQI